MWFKLIDFYRDMEVYCDWMVCCLVKRTATDWREKLLSRLRLRNIYAARVTGAQGMSSCGWKNIAEKAVGFVEMVFWINIEIYCLPGFLPTEFAWRRLERLIVKKVNYFLFLSSCLKKAFKFLECPKNHTSKLCNDKQFFTISLIFSILSAFVIYPLINVSSLFYFFIFYTFIIFSLF